MCLDIHLPDDLEVEALTSFGNLFGSCKKDIQESIAAWREITGPIARELSCLQLQKNVDDPFFQAAERGDNMTADVSGMGDEVGGKLD